MLEKPDASFSLSLSSPSDDYNVDVPLDMFMQNSTQQNSSDRDPDNKNITFRKHSSTKEQGDHEHEDHGSREDFYGVVRPKSGGSDGAADSNNVLRYSSCSSVGGSRSSKKGCSMSEIEYLSSAANSPIHGKEFILKGEGTLVREIFFRSLI